MEKLKKEYTDIRNVKHKVEHMTVSDQEGGSRERIAQELLQALTRPGKRVPAV